MNERNKPVTEVRYGAVKAAVWRNETEAGPRYSVSFSRLYRDGEQWKNADSFGRDDLLLLAKVADTVHTWIYEQGREVPAAAGGGTPGVAAPRPGGAAGPGRGGRLTPPPGRGG